MDDQLFLRPFTGLHTRNRVIATPSWIEMCRYRRSRSRPRDFCGDNGLHHHGDTVAFRVATANADYAEVWCDWRLLAWCAVSIAGLNLNHTG